MKYQGQTIQEMVNLIMTSFLHNKNEFDFTNDLVKSELFSGFDGEVLYNLLLQITKPLPIESAPKDGTVIDIFSPTYGRVVDVSYGECYKAWHKPTRLTTLIVKDATHWLPIPQVKG